MDRIGGSGVFARDSDTILTLTMHEEKDCFTVETDFRNFAPLSPFVVEWNWPLFDRKESNPSALKGSGPPGRQAKYIVEDVMRHMHWEEPTRVAKLLKKTSETGMSRATFFRLWDKLQETGSIEEKEDGWLLKQTESHNESQ